MTEEEIRRDERGKILEQLEAMAEAKRSAAIEHLEMDAVFPFFNDSKQLIAEGVSIRRIALEIKRRASS